MVTGSLVPGILLGILRLSNADTSGKINGTLQKHLNFFAALKYPLRQAPTALHLVRASGLPPDNYVSRTISPSELIPLLTVLDEACLESYTPPSCAVTARAYTFGVV